jgi:hypothetical protein
MLSVLALTALALAALQWLVQLVAERHREVPAAISREFAARFALPPAMPTESRHDSQLRPR